jgi:hypothetical protein
MPSAMQWASLSTGLPFERHNVSSFYIRGPDLAPRGFENYVGPYQSVMRSATTFWELLGDAGWRVGVVGAPSSWPAPVVANGFLVSNYTKERPEGVASHDAYRQGRYQLTYAGSVYCGDGLRQTHPQTLIDELAPVIRAKESSSNDDLAEFLPTLRARMEAVLSAPKQRRTLVDEHLGATLEDVARLYYYDHKWVFVANEIYAAAAEHLLATKDLDLLVVMQTGLDQAFHREWTFRSMRERLFPDVFPPDDGSVLEEYYGYLDRSLERLLRRCSKDTTLIIASEHGNGVDAAGNQIDHHTHPADGVFICSGPAVKSSGSVSVHLYDVFSAVVRCAGFKTPPTRLGECPAGLCHTNGEVMDPLAERPPVMGDLVSTHAVDQGIQRRLETIGFLDRGFPYAR